MRYSTKWKNWVTQIDEKTCKPCKANNGKIYEIAETITPSPPLHPHCRCTIERLKSLFAGEATDKKQEGADWYLKYKGVLPDYYITKVEAEQLGYKSYLGNLNEISPKKMLIKGEYRNMNKHLPSKIGRIWYEADINYKSGYRNHERILFSNDGLIFVTYDHYNTFVEVR